MMSDWLSPNPPHITDPLCASKTKKVNLSKYRNRHINYTSDDFIRFDFKTDQSDLLSNLELKEVNIYNPNQCQIDSLPLLLKGKTKAINIWGGNYKNCYAFEELKSIQFISLHNNNKLQFLWAVEKNNKLKGVGLIGCNKIDSIQFLNQNPSITEFHLAGDIWKKQTIRTINPLNKLQNLKFLSLTQLRIEDKNHKALFELSNLKELIISENIFTTEQFAELSVKLEAAEKRPSHKHISKPPRRSASSDAVFCWNRKKNH